MELPSADTISRYQRFIARSFPDFVAWSDGLDDLAERHREHVARINDTAERVDSFLERHSNHG